MKSDSEIIEQIYQFILSKIEKHYFQDYENRTIKVDTDITIDRVIWFIYFEANDRYSMVSTSLIFDLWDEQGHKMKSNKENIRNAVEQKLIKHLEKCGY